jgi:hypothetical protein
MQYALFYVIAHFINEILDHYSMRKWRKEGEIERRANGREGEKGRVDREGRRRRRKEPTIENTRLGRGEVRCQCHCARGGSGRSRLVVPAHARQRQLRVRVRVVRGVRGVVLRRRLLLLRQLFRCRQNDRGRHRRGAQVRVDALPEGEEHAEAAAMEAVDRAGAGTRWW